MSEEAIELSRLRLDEAKHDLELRKFERDAGFLKQYGSAIWGLVGTIVASIFAIAQIQVADIQKSKELEAANILREREIAIAASNNQARLRLDIADFVFKNKDVLFTSADSPAQKQIVNVIAVTFPSDISSIFLERLKSAVPEEQKKVIDQGRQLVRDIQLQQAAQIKLYYVIAMTSVSKEDLIREKSRIESTIGRETFKSKFPNIEVYAPEGSLYTLLLNREGLPYEEANNLKTEAIKAGFSSGTWLWQNNVEYFAAKR